MSTSAKIKTRLLEERSVADENAQKHLQADALKRWDSCGSAHRFMAFEGKEIIAFRLLFDTPQIIDTFKCVGLDTGLKAGISSLWKSQSKGNFWVSATPVEVADNCFLWMHKYTQLEFVTYKGAKSLKFSMGYRTLLNPTNKVEGPSYLLERSVFNSTYPSN